MSKLFVWDFHGTLEKGNEMAALEVSNIILEQQGYDARFNEQHAIDLYGKKWFEYFAFLLPDESYERHIEMQQACMEWPGNKEVIARHIQPNDHAHDVLAAIAEHGHDQILISNTSERALPSFIDLVGMDDFFDGDNAFAVMAHAREAKRTKRHVLEEFLAEAGVFDEIVAVGDSLSDVELVEPEQGRGFLYRHSDRPLDVELPQHVTPIHDLRDILTAA
ncbi:MAG TPA: HAD family hydrolase [Candidatus Saccharimonadales bacterium]|jgi:phosphoglycolate phosphatase-like HAD superfamily hydrolase|nr:HAD family hydrolase [Candidatus Saccharimonadales bacterium]